MSQDIDEIDTKTFAELLSGPTVDVYVGPEKRHWRIHCNLLAFHSEQLQSELQKQWDQLLSQDDSKSEPADSLEIKLEDESASGFELLVKWLYQGKLEDVSSFASPEDKYAFAISCHHLYLLSIRFGLNRLRDMAIDQYREGLEQAGLVPDNEELSEIYKRSPADSPFRTLMTRIAARQIMDPDNERDASSYRTCFEESPDFAIQLINAIKDSTGGVLLSDPTEGAGCEYHDHQDGSGCYLKSKEPLKLDDDSETNSAIDSPPDSPSPQSWKFSTPKRMRGFLKETPQRSSDRAESKSLSNSTDHDGSGKTSQATTTTSTPVKRQPPKLAIRHHAPSAETLVA